MKEIPNQKWLREQGLQADDVAAHTGCPSRTHRATAPLCNRDPSVGSANAALPLLPLCAGRRSLVLPRNEASSKSSVLRVHPNWNRRAQAGKDASTTATSHRQLLFTPKNHSNHDSSGLNLTPGAFLGHRSSLHAPGGNLPCCIHCMNLQSSPRSVQVAAKRLGSVKWGCKAPSGSST